MRKLFTILLAVLITTVAAAQSAPKKNYTLGNKAGDHLMIQLGTNSWQGTPDSVSSRIKSFNRSANVYLMLNKPFKANPKLSVAIGVGVGTSNIYFNKMNVLIESTKSTLPFIRTDTGSNYKKYKLATAYLEIPVELRFTSMPDNPNKAIKVAVGFKAGTLLNAHTKGSGLQTSSGAKLNTATVKQNSKSYFNSTRLAATARVGYGIFSLFGAYNITNIFKDGVARDTKLLQLGLTISGL